MSALVVAGSRGGGEIKLARIRTGNTTAGRPGFKTKGATRSQVGGGQVPKDKVKVKGVRRLFARDPAKRTALIGTSKDVIFSNKNINTVAKQSPEIKRGSEVARKTTPQRKLVVNKTANRSVKKLK
jgi:hypothetical protein